MRLMMVYEMLDITFFIMSLKIPTKLFGFIEFSDKALRSESSQILLKYLKSDHFRHFYFFFTLTSFLTFGTDYHLILT